jgi:hypothetical protein
VSRPLRLGPLLLAATALLTACGGPAPDATATPGQASPSPAASRVSPATPASPSPAAEETGWAVGASPLPLRPDGFGQVLPTPPELRDRRMTRPSGLEPPVGGRFTATAGPVTPEIRARMGETWSPACPVGLDELRYLMVSFRGFDGAAHTGELVVHADVADDVVEVFRQLFAADFPIEEMRLPGTADMTAAPTGDGNNTAGYVCRAARGQTSWSEHAYGRAVDVNPFHNPLAKRDLVVPELASAYADRAVVRPGMVVRGGVVVEAFRSVAWKWGGDWRSSKDWMHFSRNGR